jgi:Tfp pilus assembly protein PilX
MTRATRQQGATLLVAMIMLIMLTLFAVSAMNTSIVNLRMVGNMQNRAEALDATQRTIETAISTTRFVDFPTDAIDTDCGTPNTFCTDLNGDGVDDLITTLTPTPACIQSKITKISDLVIAGPASEDVACLQAQTQGQFAVAGAMTSGDSLCGQTVWNITAQTLQKGTTAATSEVNYTATQGIGVRVPALAITTSCP